MLLDPGRVGIERRVLDARVATFSIDVETDYGTGRTEALSRIDRFLDLVDELGIPLTAFVEGQLFEKRRETCALLLDRGVDVQLHCYDHSLPGDTPEDLRRGVAAYSDFCGRRPSGYRAHTYRLTDELFDTLLEEGFLWDSSVMTAVAQGRNTSPEFRDGDYFVLADRLVEFPVGTWNGLPIPFNHSYRLLMKAPLEILLRAASEPGRLVAYNTHMTDLVRCDSLRAANRSPASRLLHRYMWSTHAADTFASFRGAVRYLARRGYRFESTDALYRRLIAAAPLQRSPEGRPLNPPG
jgi:peptidoglycan/xylan/chitin deacetylase (PgdA/CDA1 family)